MTYGSGSFNEAINSYNQGVSDLDNGRYESARSKLEFAKQTFQACQGTHSDARDWLDKTNIKLSQIGT
jgi:outer membrane protein assembly factor BamD (BamD/ComL family)